MKYEQGLLEQGAELVAGVDEVGIGAWAGPVVVGAVILPPGKRIYKVRDSKLLDAGRREWLADKVRSQSLCWAIGLAWPDEIDTVGLSEAIRRAGLRAYSGLSAVPDAMLVDGNWNFFKPLQGTPGAESSPGPNVKMVVRGDCESVSIACASLIAKVARDRLMERLGRFYPPYAFDSNKGYPSPFHKWALSAYGPCRMHRVLFDPIRRLIDGGTPGRLLPPGGGEWAAN